MIAHRRIKVLIVDDSALVRKMLSTELVKDPEIDVIGTAPDPYIARDKIVMLEPDVLLLDIEMPRMDGLSFLKILMTHSPMPVIIVSSMAGEGSKNAITALEYGALEVVEKPGSAMAVGDIGKQLIEKIKAIYQVSNFKPLINFKAKESKQKREELIETTNKIIAIGASTGGTEAIKQVLCGLTYSMPPIVIVQHMPQHFTKSFAQRLDTLCDLTIKEGEDKEILMPGKVLIAPGNKHMIVRRSGARYYVEIKDGEMVHHQRPSVEVLFQSVAQNVGQNAIGVILTGMGKDGATGLLEMRNAGAYTIGQDEQSSIVYGMPKEAYAVGAVMKVVSLTNIAKVLTDLV